MPNYIVYSTASDDEVYECAYSLLKWLDVYNLKPPADLGFRIYTHQPALLEAYSTFFPNFELKDLQPTSGEKKFELPKDAEEKTIRMPATAYPLKPLDHFSSLDAENPANGSNKNSFIARYTPLKEFNRYLRQFFRKYQEESVPNQVKLMHHIDAREIEASRRSYQQLPFLVRIARGLLGRRWNHGLKKF